MEDIGNGYTAYSLSDLQQLATEAQRLNKGNLLEDLLIAEGFTKQGNQRYTGKDPEQIIELSSDENGMSYTNKLQEADQGQLIQFLQNRLVKEHYVIPNDHFDIFFSAVQVALYFEEMNKTKQIKIPKRRAPKKGKGRGI